jgi:hypothetical protein
VTALVIVLLFFSVLGAYAAAGWLISVRRTASQHARVLPVDDDPTIAS